MMNDNDSQNIKKEKLPPVWKRSKLIEVSIIKGRIGWKGLTKSEFSNDGVLIVNGPDIKDGKVLWDKCLRIPRWRYEESADISVRKGDILVTKDGTIGKTAFIDDLSESASIASGIFLIRTKNEEILNGKFLYQYFNSENFKDLVESVIEGSVIPHLYQRDLEQLTIPLPPLDEQKAIAEILSDLDAKIEINQKMNKTLEAIAQAIFKHWFIDFEFPSEEGNPYKSSGGEMVDSELGEIPKGWDVTTVGKCVDISGGATPRTSDLHYWIGGTKYWATPKDMSDLSSPILINTERKITVEGLISIGGRLFPKGSLLLSSRAPIGYLALTDIETSVNQGIIAILPNGKLGPFYMYGWCKANVNIIKDNANGSTFAEISKSSFRSIKIILPTKRVLQLYDESFSKVYTKLTNNTKQSVVLSNIRDTLLSRLMSGKIRVPLED